jgi:hypothetical protein
MVCVAGQDHNGARRRGRAIKPRPGVLWALSQARKRVSAPKVAVTANTMAATGQKLRATSAQKSAAPVRQNRAMINPRAIKDATFKAVIECPLPR